MNTTTKVILGVTLAAATGAAIGMLLAPEKGSDLQKRIKDNSKDWLSAFLTVLSTGKEIASKLTERDELAYEEQNSQLNERRDF